MNIFDILAKFDLQHKDVYSQIPEEEKKKSGPWMLMRWMSAAQNYPEHSMLMVNDLVNVNFSVLRHHPEMQHRLLSIAGVGKKDRHYWIAPGKKKAKNKIEIAVAQCLPDIADQEMELLLTLMDQTEIRDLLERHGWQKKEIDEVFK